MPLAPGTNLGPYLILDQLGAGGMGEVYRAHDQRLDRDVAIKILPEHIAEEPHSRTRFEREARALAGLSHPNILSIFDVGEYGTIAYVVTELLQGGTLRERITAGAMDWQEAVLTALQIAEGLSAAHSRGIVHRDLKPENIFITSDKRIKILDFGLARAVSVATPEAETGSITPTTTVAGTVVGTLGYMSPEQVRGEPVDGRSDQFSFGCVLYEMLAGQRPFAKPTIPETMASILRDDPPGLRASGLLIPEELEAVVFTCLRKRPEHRFATVTKILEALQSLATAGFANVILRPLPTTSGGALQWSRLRLPLTVALIAGLAFAGVLMLIPGHPAGPPVVKTADQPKHVAVLPFRNIGDDPTNKAFCDGLLETLTSKLTQMEQFHQPLWVVPTSEVLGEDVASASEARRKLGVNLVITGSIQRESDLVQLTINLIDAQTSRQLQSEIIQSSTSSISDFEGNAVSKLTDMLQLQLTPEASKRLFAGGTTRSEAYSNYIQGLGHLERYDRAEDLQQAIDYFNKAIISDPRYALAYVGLAESYRLLNWLKQDEIYLKQATDYINKAVELNPDLPEVIVSLAAVKRRAGRLDEAINLYRKVLAHNPSDASARSGMANTLEDLGQLSEAEMEFKKAIELRPAYWGGYNDLGSFYFYRGRFKEAAGMFEQALKLTPDNLKCLSNLAGTYYQQGKSDDAQRIFERIISIRPSSEAYSNLGTILFFKKQYRESVPLFQKAIALEGQRSSLWGNLGDALRYTGDVKESEAAYARAITFGKDELEKAPGSPTLHASIGVFYSRIKQCPKAIDQITKAEKLDPGNPLVKYKAAIALDLCGAHGDAVSALSEALAHGYPKEQMMADPDLTGFLKDPVFSKLLSSTSASK